MGSAGISTGGRIRRVTSRATVPRAMSPPSRLNRAIWAGSGVTVELRHQRHFEPHQ